MKLLKVNEWLSISGQLEVTDMEQLLQEGVAVVICNRPDKEADDQPLFSELAAAANACGIEAINVPFKSGEMDSTHVAKMVNLQKQGVRVHAFCRTGNRSLNLYAAAHASMGLPQDEIIRQAEKVGIAVAETIAPYYQDGKNAMTTQVKGESVNTMPTPAYDIVIVGAGSGGIAAASSLQKRDRGLRIAVIDPAEVHYYQPGWTMVGGGVFDVGSTKRRMQDLIPSNISWIKQAVSGFQASENEVVLEDGSHVRYRHLIVAPGLKLDWDAIDGLKQSLGKNGVTSNYSFDLAPYTWELVKNLKNGKALFTQPPMPIKCAGAPQKALYLSCDHWLRNNVLNNIKVDFCNAGGVLFGVSDYVPALQSYIDRYGANVNYFHNLEAIDGEKKVAYFKITSGDKEGEKIEKPFDMIHVCPPQRAPEFVASSELAGEGGWLEVDQFSLRHSRFSNVWGLGDVMNTPNAKTMAAVRKQVPVVAENIISALNDKPLRAGYDGYGSCPLTVEKGKIVLAEFGYGGKLIPSFPEWVLKGTQPTRAAWMLKKDILPGIYWKAMLKGREWMAGPADLDKLRA
jgi:sulfide:quinone oxidoreductase